MNTNKYKKEKRKKKETRYFSLRSFNDFSIRRFERGGRMYVLFLLRFSFFKASSNYWGREREREKYEEWKKEKKFFFSLSFLKLSDDSIQFINSMYVWWSFSSFYSFFSLRHSSRARLSLEEQGDKQKRYK